MSSDLIEYLREVLSPLGPVRSKRMFGGVGIYISDLFCVIIVDDCLYFKADLENVLEFTAAHCPPFTYKKEGIAYQMQYYRVPDAAMDDAQEMRQWAKLGMAAALRKTAKPKAKVKAKTKKGSPTAPKNARPTSL